MKKLAILPTLAAGVLLVLSPRLDADYEITKLIPPGIGLTPYYGWAVVGDGERVAVCDAGQNVFVFGRDGHLEATIPAVGHFFGRQMAMQGGLLVIASTHAVHTYRSTPGGWLLTDTLADSALASGLALDNGLLAVGWLSSGKARVELYRRGAVSWTPDLTIESPAIGSSTFGGAIALDGNRLVVSEHDGFSAADAAYVYARTSSSDWDLVQTIHPVGLADVALFASSIQLCGDWLAFGVPTMPPFFTGQVQVFRRSEGPAGDEWRLVQVLSENENEGFGNDLLITRQGLFVGAPYADSISASPLGGGAGAVYRYVLAPSSAEPWVLRERVEASDPTFEGGFGFSLAAVRGGVLVGAPPEGSGEGDAYVVQVD